MSEQVKKQKIGKNTPILVIGFGSIGERHYRNLLTLGYRNVSVYDIDAAKLAKVGIPAVSSLAQEVLEQFPVVFICNPSHLHVATALRAAKAGCHIFIEKPLALSTAHLKELGDIVQKKHLTAMVACNYRFHPGFQLLAKKISSKELGKPLLVHVSLGHDLTLSRKGVDYRTTYAADPKKGGGVIMDSGSHVVDYLTALFGKIKHGAAHYGNISSLEIRSEDYASALLEFASGVQGTLVLDYFGKPKRHTLEVQCERGMVRWDFSGNVVEWYSARTEKIERKHLYENIEKSVARNDMYLKEVSYFFETITGVKEPISDIAHARLVTETLVALKTSRKKKV